MTAVERTIDPDCPFNGFCGDPVDGRLCDTCMTPEERGPEPEYKEHRITQPCKPCAGCGKAFVPQDRSKGIDGDIAWVTGEPMSWRRYHDQCKPEWK